MATVYFLGAGASAADDLPLTNELNLAIAHESHDGSPSSCSGTRVAQLLFGFVPSQVSEVGHVARANTPD